MQTNVVVLPLDPNGPVRALHERIKTSGLSYEQPRFTFTPHVTLSFFRELSPKDAEALLAVRVHEPVTIDRISAHRTADIANSQKLLELTLEVTIIRRLSRRAQRPAPHPLEDRRAAHAERHPDQQAADDVARPVHVEVDAAHRDESDDDHAHGR